MRLHRLPLAASLCSLLFATLAAGPVGAEDAPLPSDPATELARATSGVGKVVKVFEILTEAELAALQSK